MHCFIETKITLYNRITQFHLNISAHQHLSMCANIVTHIQVGARSTNCRIPSIKVRKTNTSSSRNIDTVIIRLHLIEPSAATNHTALDRRGSSDASSRGSRGSRWLSSRGGRLGSRSKGVETDIVANNQVRALRANGRIPGVEILQGDSGVAGEVVAAVAPVDSVELIAVGCHS